MLSCGSVCRPTVVKEELQLLESSTRPARVLTDDGEGFIKGVGNPQGMAALISELVAGELAAGFGLDVPPFAVIPECGIEIQMIGQPGLMKGPLFFSLAVDGSPRDGSDIFLSKLVRPSDIPRLVIFDTWVRNADRYCEGEANSENLLFVLSDQGRRYRLMPIDHTHCFVEIEFDEDAAAADAVQDDRIYGNFPEFAPYMAHRAIASALRDLADLDRSWVEEIVASVPPQWGLTVPASVALVNLICDRADYLVRTLGIKLVDAPELPWS